MDLFVGLLCIAMGGYLFKDGRSRIYKIFALLGAGAGYFLFPIANSILGGMVPEEYVGPIGAALGAMYAYSITRTAERALTTMGPPVAIILGYEYLRVEKGVDLLEYVTEIPQMPNITNEMLQGFLFMISTFLTLWLRSYLRKAVPIVVSGGMSGFLLVTGGDTIRTGEMPASTFDIEMVACVVVSLLSIATQVYFMRKDADERLEESIYRTDRRIAGLKAANEMTKGGSVAMIRCPACSKESSHQIVNRKEGADNVEVTVKCLGKDEFDFPCNNVHVVHEVKSA